MQRYFDTLADARGNVQAGLSVLVKIGGQNATIYSDNGTTAQANPMTSDSNGGISFYAANGTYDLSLVAASGSVTALRSQIILFDPLDCEDATPTSSDTVLGVQGGVVKRFNQDELGPVVSVFRYLSASERADVVAQTSLVDTTTAIRTAATALDSSGGRLIMPRGKYKITIPQGESLISLSGTSGIVIDASEAILDNSATSYTADELTPIFLLDDCDDTTIHIGEYIGYTLPTPETHLGYRGATLVRAINGTTKTKVRAKITNARYGVQTGEYGDATKGQCSGFEIDITGSMIGYPLAAYYADDIQFNINADGIHRAAYLAGCYGVYGVARWKNQYIADTVILLTDSLTSGTDAAAQADPVGAATTSRGCTNVDVISIDKGSTVYATNTSCAGIGLSRVDACEFRNIRVCVYSKGTDSISPIVGAWRIVSGAKAVWNRYSYNFEPTVVLDNIEVSGVIDHSAVTGDGNSGSEYYVVTYDTDVSHAATMRNIRTQDFTFLKSAAHTRDMFFHAPGLGNAALFDGYHAPGVGMAVITTSSVPTVFRRSTGGDLDVTGISGGSRVILEDGTSFSTETCNVDITNTFVDGGTIGGAGASVRQREKVLTLSGASTSWTNAVFAGEMVLGVQGYVQTEITGATGYQVGVSGALTRYVDTNTLTAASTFGPANAATTETAPRIYFAATGLVVTAKTSNFTAGALRLVVTYIKFSVPTS